MTVSTPEARRLLIDGQIALARIEENGMRVDKAYLEDAMLKADRQIADMEADLKSRKLWTRWKKEFPEKANLGSPEQLAHMAFTVMGYEAKAFTTGGETGTGKKRPKADKEAFEEIDHPYIRKIQRMKQIEKAKSTYLGGIQREMTRGRNGLWYVHTHYHMNIARSFRSTSSDPNVQNIPVRDFEIMEMVRRCYVPDPGNEFVEIDYAAHEAKMIADHSYDPVLMKFIAEKDMHREVAMMLFGLTAGQVSKMCRYIAKNGAVFPLFYGSAYFLIAADVWKFIKILNAKVEGTETSIREHLATQGITERGACVAGETPQAGTFEARVKAVEDKFWSPKMFGKTMEWKRQFYREYQKNGGFWIRTGFWIPGFHKRNDVTNYGPQGQGFHCLLLSIIREQRWLDKYKMKTKIRNQVHDSQLLDCPPKERDDVIAEATRIMKEAPAKQWSFMRVPLDCEVELCGTDGSWNAKAEHTQQDGTWKPKPKK